MKKFLISLALLFWCGTAWAGTLYVDTATGDNGNAGTYSAPVKEMIRAQELGSNGDTVYVKSGTYVEPSVSGSGANGFTPTKAITWVAVQSWDGTGVPTLGGTVILQNYSGTVNMYISGDTVKSFTGFVFDSAVAYGVLTSGAVGQTTFSGCTFRNATNTNLYFFTSSAGALIINSSVFQAAGSTYNIRAAGGNAITINNTTFSNSGTSTDLYFATSLTSLTINGGSASRSGASGYFITNDTASTISISGTSFANYAMGGSGALVYTTAVIPITIDGVTIASSVSNGYLVRTSVANTAPVIVRNSNITTSSSNIAAFLLNGQGAVTIMGNIFVSGKTGTQTDIAIQLATLASGGGATTITNNYFVVNGYSTSGNFIDVRNRFDAVTISRNTIIMNHASGTVAAIYVLDGNAPSITDNIIRVTAGAGSQPAIWIDQSNASVATTVATIARNKIYSVSEAGYYIALGTEVTGTGDNNYDGSIIEHNEIYGVNYTGGTATSVHGIFVGFNIKCHVRYNYMNGAFYGAVIKSNSFDWDNTGGLYGNMFINNNYMGIYNKGSVNLNIFNNTIYNNAATSPEYGGIYCAANVAANSSGTKIYNNIISLPKARTLINIAASNNTGVVISNNLYFNADGSTSDTKFYFPSSVYTTFATWAAAASDTNSVYGDPMFRNLNMKIPADAKILSGSKARAIGKAISTTGVTYTQDYFGGVIPSFINAGASGRFESYTFRRGGQRIRR